jgi:lipopolysaccharide transport system ATP-binding protein
MAINAIEATNISKCYVIHHEQQRQRPSLRETVGRGFSRMLAPTSKKVKGNADETFWALKDIDFTVQQGDRFAILGKNGAGKSTLLKIISRITAPTTGSLHIKGKVASLLEVGTGFHVELTGRENIFLNGAILGMSKSYIRRRFDEIVDFSEVENFLDTPVKRYSSGMYMRLAFAVAAHLEPDILIVDEVLAVGDAQFQKKCLAKMDDISRKEGRSVLFVSHNIEATRSFCNKGIYLEAGKIILQGDMESLSSLYAARLHAEQLAFAPKTEKRIYFNSLTVVKDNITFNETLRLDCEICSTVQLPSYVIGLSITDKFDRIAGSMQFYADKALQKGSNLIQLAIPARNIVPGTYRIVIAIAPDIELNNEDVVWYYPSFTVLPDKAHAHLFSQWNLNWSANVLTGSTIL